MKALWCMAVVLLGCSFVLAQSQYKVLWTFSGPPNDGYIPKSNLVLDKTGNLYGTTEGGGSSTAPLCPGGCGVVFRLSPNQDGTWTNTILYSFCTQYINSLCQDGAYPQAGLIFDAQGNLYGTTVNGGALGCPQAGHGCGTVFELSPQGGSSTEKVLYSFCENQANNNCLDGNFPLGHLTQASGNLYGTTESGGTVSAGTVFELSHGGSGWTETVLYSFCPLGKGEGCTDGAEPQAGVTFDKAGSLYGTTELGGSHNQHGTGTLYKLSPGVNGWTETVLHSFHSSAASPLGSVSFDASGNLYGTFAGGGPDRAGGGFRIRAKTGKFGAFFFNSTGGFEPEAGVLVDSKHATGYTTTTHGGAANGGTVLKVTAGQETVLYNFCSQANCADGATPVGDLISDAAGNLYGTAEQGGNNSACGISGCGVVFEIVQSGSR